jgi:hypothetical protein
MKIKKLRGIRTDQLAVFRDGVEQNNTFCTAPETRYSLYFKFVEAYFFGVCVFPDLPQSFEIQGGFNL